MTKPRVQSKYAFRLMTVKFRLRDRLNPPIKILRKIGACAGMTVLDFGCGPGGFATAAARLVGPHGRVYAVDINPLAVQAVERAARKKKLANIQTILGNHATPVPDCSVDIALLYDLIHHLDAPRPTLAEIRRTLKPDGFLSVSDHHLAAADIRKCVTGGGLFQAAGDDGKIFRFEPTNGRAKGKEQRHAT